jgi:hypothetical protein
MAYLHSHECPRCTRKTLCTQPHCPKKVLCPGCALGKMRGTTRAKALAASDRLARLRGRAMARAQGRLR